MVDLINKQLLLTAYAYLFLMEQQKEQQGSEALQLQMKKAAAEKAKAAEAKALATSPQPKAKEKAKQEAAEPKHPHLKDSNAGSREDLTNKLKKALEAAGPPPQKKDSDNDGKNKAKEQENYVEEQKNILENDRAEWIKNMGLSGAAGAPKDWGKYVFERMFAAELWLNEPDSIYSEKSEESWWAGTSEHPWTTEPQPSKSDLLRKSRYSHEVDGRTVDFRYEELHRVDDDAWGAASFKQVAKSDSRIEGWFRYLGPLQNCVPFPSAERPGVFWFVQPLPKKRKAWWPFRARFAVMTCQPFAWFGQEASKSEIEEKFPKGIPEDFYRIAVPKLSNPVLDQSESSAGITSGAPETHLFSGEQVQHNGWFERWDNPAHRAKICDSDTIKDLKLLDFAELKPFFAKRHGVSPIHVNAFLKSRTGTNGGKYPFVGGYYTALLSFAHTGEGQGTPLCPQTLREVRLHQGICHFNALLHAASKRDAARHAAFRTVSQTFLETLRRSFLFEDRIIEAWKGEEDEERRSKTVATTLSVLIDEECAAAEDSVRTLSERSDSAGNRSKSDEFPAESDLSSGKDTREANSKSKADSDSKREGKEPIFRFTLFFPTLTRFGHFFSGLIVVKRSRSPKSAAFSTFIETEANREELKQLVHGWDAQKKPESYEIKSLKVWYATLGDSLKAEIKPLLSALTTKKILARFDEMIARAVRASADRVSFEAFKADFVADLQPDSKAWTQQEVADKTNDTIASNIFRRFNWTVTYHDGDDFHDPKDCTSGTEAAALTTYDNQCLQNVCKLVSRSHWDSPRFSENSEEVRKGLLTERSDVGDLKKWSTRNNNGKKTAFKTSRPHDSQMTGNCGVFQFQQTLLAWTTYELHHVRREFAILPEQDIPGEVALVSDALDAAWHQVAHQFIVKGVVSGLAKDEGDPKLWLKRRLRKNPKWLKFVHAKAMTGAGDYMFLCLTAVQQSAFALRFVNAAAMEQKDYMLLCRTAAQQSAFALELVNAAAIGQAGYNSVCLAAVQQSGCALRMVDAAGMEQTDYMFLCLTAVQQSAFALEFVNAEDFEGDADYTELCVVAVKKKADVWRYVRGDARKVLDKMKEGELRKNRRCPDPTQDDVDGGNGLFDSVAHILEQQQVKNPKNQRWTIDELRELAKTEQDKTSWLFTLEERNGEEGCNHDDLLALARGLGKKVVVRIMEPGEANGTDPLTFWPTRGWDVPAKEEVALVYRKDAGYMASSLFDVGAPRSALAWPPQI